MNGALYGLLSFRLTQDRRCGAPAIYEFTTQVGNARGATSSTASQWIADIARQYTASQFEKVEASCEHDVLDRVGLADGEQLVQVWDGATVFPANPAEQHGKVVAGRILRVGVQILVVVELLLGNGNICAGFCSM
jgi:thiazole synthase ThiGH ThiG subunit